MPMHTPYMYVAVYMYMYMHMHIALYSHISEIHWLQKKFSQSLVLHFCDKALHCAVRTNWVV